MPRAVRFAWPLLGYAFPPSRRLAHCAGCGVLIKEVAEDCWADYYRGAASCPAGDLHQPRPVEALWTR